MFKLYITAGCHLCDLAFEQLAECAAVELAQVQNIEIGDDAQLVARYGIRIPVLQHPDGRELDWPFDPQQIAAFVSAAP